jgi:uncharacterized protein (TIGR03083 family)
MNYLSLIITSSAMHIHHVVPIEVKHLFPVLDVKLKELLSSLSEADWQKPTIAGLWTVKDVAAHLLDGNMRTLSILRDKYQGDKPENIGGYTDLVGYLNELNAGWVQAFKRVSPKLLIELLEITGKKYTDYITSLDPWAEAGFPVAWAGEEISLNWLHTAREYSEKWLHQQQIREAVGKDDGLFEKALFHPLVSTFMCALPYAYRNVQAVTGTSVVVKVEGLEDEWHINKTDEGWVLRKETRLEPNAHISLSKDMAWKLFSRGVKPEEAVETIKIIGDKELGMVALGMVSVMA